jgi:hypothetical protein
LFQGTLRAVPDIYEEQMKSMKARNAFVMDIFYGHLEKTNLRLAMALCNNYRRCISYELIMLQHSSRVGRHHSRFLLLLQTLIYSSSTHYLFLINKHLFILMYYADFCFLLKSGILASPFRYFINRNKKYNNVNS